MSSDVDAFAISKDLRDVVPSLETMLSSGHGLLDHGQHGIFLIQDVNHETEVALRMTRVRVVFDVFAFEKDTRSGAT